MLKRLLVCLFLLTAASRASAVDYTDIYLVLGEDGYGFNVVQNDSQSGSFLFITFFIYGPDKQPTWYTAQLTQDQSGNYNGLLYATTGTFYGMPWNPSDHPKATQVGTASFQPTSPYTAKFIYIVTTPQPLAATVTKSIQRQFLGNFLIGGTYSGVAASTFSGCANPAQYFDDVDITVTQDSNSVSIALTYLAGGTVCTYQGNATAWGKLYQIPSASYTCTDGSGSKTGAKIDELIATPHGIEGVWSDISPDGCNESGTFSGLLR